MKRKSNAYATLSDINIILAGLWLVWAKRADRVILLHMHLQALITLVVSIAGRHHRFCRHGAVFKRLLCCLKPTLSVISAPDWWRQHNDSDTQLKIGRRGKRVDQHRTGLPFMQKFALGAGLAA